MTSINVGDIVPDFKLKDQKDQEITLSGLKGKKVLLSFHPLAWTPICATQMKDLERNFDRLAEANCIPLGLSIDSIFCKKAWGESLQITKLSLVSDFWPHGELAKKLGLFFEEHGFSNRANVLVDENGKAIWVKVYPTKQLPDIDEVLKKVKGT